MRSRPSVLLALPLMAGVLAAVPAAGQAKAPCAGERQVARAFTPAGHLVASRAVACTLPTGFLTSETHVRVAPDGTVIQQPAQTVPGVAGTGFVAGAPGPKPQTQVTPAGFAITRDGGRRFERVLPAGIEWVASDGAIHVDEVTGRLYYYALSPSTVPQAGGVGLADQLPAGYAHLVTSGDGGRTWVHSQAPGYVESENPRFTSGPTPRGGDRPVPGERIAYWCGNTALFVYGQRDCFRTLDGGQTWRFRSTLLRRGTPVHPECAGSQESFDAGDGYYPQMGPDGTLWSLVSCGSSTYLARSTDEGASFPVLRLRGLPLRTPAFDELRVDNRGTLYGVQKSGTKLLLRTSRDAGRTWGAAVDLVAPGLRGAAVGQWALALRGPGQLAAAYLTARSGGGWNGSVTVSRNAAAARPVLVTATVHDGKRVMVTSPQSAKDDYIDVDVAPDGSAWAGFYADCGADAACATSPQNPMAKIGLLLHVG
ncbi:MAG TPA: sialidase family protein [Mycobacteriales bacterium]|nr:sialidase family protein [Mycobacteriales bacterium]